MSDSHDDKKRLRENLDSHLGPAEELPTPKTKRSSPQPPVGCSALTAPTTPSWLAMLRRLHGGQDS